jgi:hypothetical protein
LTSQITHKGLLLAGWISLALAVPALAAPAGKEYLPKVPKSAGGEVRAQGTQGPGGTILEPQARGAGKNGEGAATGDSNAQSGTPSTNTSTGDSGSTIFNPIVLLMIAGVIAAAVGLTLRRRQGGRPATEGGAEPEAQPRARPTPDGEIVAGDRDDPATVAGDGEIVAGRERNL